MRSAVLLVAGVLGTAITASDSGAAVRAKAESGANLAALHAFARPAPATQTASATPLSVVVMKFRGAVVRRAFMLAFIESSASSPRMRGARLRVLNQHLPELVEQLMGALLTLFGIVRPVEKGVVLGEGEPGARANELERDHGKR